MEAAAHFTGHRHRVRAGAACALALLAIGLAGCAASGGGSGAGAKLGLSPAPNSLVASPQTQLSVRGARISELRDVIVTGSNSGRHDGRLVAHAAGAGASFLPDKPFAPGERVDVSLRVGGDAAPVRFHFTVARPAALSTQPGLPGRPTNQSQIQSPRSAPDLHPPAVTVTTDTSDAAPGDIFLSPRNKLGQAGPMILDNRGRLIWFHPLPAKYEAFAFEAQRYRGKPVLTWWQGIVNNRGFGVGEDVIYDSSYRQIATVKAGNGYEADLHDFTLTPHGTALITAYNPVHTNMSSVGGPTNGTVIDGVVQEIDVRTGLVLFEWHSLGNVPLSDSYAKPASDGLFDYFHVNSVALDSDGNLIVSARNTWAIYKINHRTGKIIWQLGGKHSSFEMGAGAQFAYQHDARRQPDGTITVFDNGADPKVHPQSRTLALRLDLRTMTASVVREWTHPKKLVAGSQGNMQTLPNGDRFVGWGSEPNLTEFSPDGRVLFDAVLAAPDTSYRAYRFAWSGTPTGKPAIATSIGGGGTLTVCASWNGATSVARWRILSGAAPGQLKPVAQVARSGFETSAKLSTKAPYVAVEAQDAGGHVLGTSDAVTPGMRAS